MRSSRVLALYRSIAGYTNMGRLDAVPADAKENATVFGMDRIRYRADEASQDMAKDAVQAYERELAQHSVSKGAGDLPPL